MAKRKQDESAAGEAAAQPDDIMEQHQSQLPLIEAPPLSPAKQEAGSEPAAPETASLATAPEAATGASPAAGPAAAPAGVAATSGYFPRLRLKLRPRYRRYATLAASVAIAAATGVVVGATATGGFYKPAPVDVVGLEENKAAQQSIARLSKEISSLKASLEAANKSANAQFAKITERLSREAAEITGAVKPPQTVPPVSQATAPMPLPRPVETSHRPAIVSDWTIRETRDGFVYVQGHGDVYQVVPGAPLPGLGTVEQIKRQEGRWVVVTPKGIIVSLRDRRYFEQF
ncbi:MAG TPA: hypothetical protein VFB29_09820 [Pseudolabrys sp.]|nr:hypothetical protein [Pseudolabrys sp.]